MPGRSATRAARTLGDDFGEGDERLVAFCAGLYPILVAGDAAAFGRYLAQWEDVIGDTAELAETPIEQQRKTMAALLRRPQQFNLPPWRTTGEPRSAPDPEFVPHRDAHPEPKSGAVEQRGQARGAYQLDMLTGEFIPVAETTSRAVEDEPPHEQTATPPKHRSPRRRGSAKLAQLALWPEPALPAGAGNRGP